jgi:hypothetical protein
MKELKNKKKNLENWRLITKYKIPNFVQLKNNMKLRRKKRKRGMIEKLNQ